MYLKFFPEMITSTDYSFSAKKNIQDLETNNIPMKLAQNIFIDISFFNSAMPIIPQRKIQKINLQNFHSRSDRAWKIGT